MTSRDLWLQRTGQAWKLAPAAGLLGLGLACLGLAFVVDGRHSVVDWVSVLLVAMAVLDMSAMLWLAFGIRCPSCGRHPVVRILRSSAPDMIWLTQVCPYCGYDGRSDATSAHGSKRSS